MRDVNRRSKRMHAFLLPKTYQRKKFQITLGQKSMSIYETTTEEHVVQLTTINNLTLISSAVLILSSFKEIFNCSHSWSLKQEDEFEFLFVMMLILSEILYLRNTTDVNNFDGHGYNNILVLKHLKEPTALYYV